MSCFYKQARAAAEDLVLTKSGGSVSVPEPPTHPEVRGAGVLTYTPPYAALLQIPGAESKENPPKALSAVHHKDGGTIYATAIMNKIFGRAFNVPGAGEEGILYVAVDNAIYNDMKEPFYHKGRYLYNSVPSEDAVRQGREVVVGLLTCEAAMEELQFVLFMGADNAAMNKELARLKHIPGVQGSRVKDITRTLTDSPRPFGLKDGSALEVWLPGATQRQLWISMVHAGAYPIYLERLPADQLFMEVPRGIDDAMKALRTLSGRPAEGAVPWGMVPGGGGMQQDDKEELQRLGLNPAEVEDVDWYYSHKGGSASVQAKEDAGVAHFMATGSSLDNPATPQEQHQFHVDCGSASVQAKEDAGVAHFMATGSSLDNPATPEDQHQFHVDCGGLGGQATQELREDMDLPARPGLRDTTFEQESALRPEDRDTAFREQCGEGGQATQELREDMDLPARPGLRDTTFEQESAMRPEDRDTAFREQCAEAGREGGAPLGSRNAAKEHVTREGESSRKIGTDGLTRQQRCRLNKKRKQEEQS